MRKDRSVLVTGAAGGIGSAVTLRLAELGFTVYAGVRSESPRLATRPGVRVVRMDVTDPVAVEAAAEEIAKETDGLHAVINNAGTIVQGPLELVPPEELRRQFEVNVYGPVHVIQAFLPLLRAGRGRLINVSAASARLAFPYLGPISAGKAALDSLSHALRVELATWGIPVVIVDPGTVDTPIFAKAEPAAATALAQTPADRAGLYTPALEAVGRAMTRLKPGPVDPAVKLIVQTVRAAHPKPRYVASSARAMTVLSRLPLRTRTGS
ncbi:SDR family NAD(P)-dependent oxidoreductase [Nonomuraea jiangxiensis]|uniref:NAD(P)-dependent dehydrogenase, short-chain alcohol dehydrogenase family n=1 Tax=Nonomuraea jiangxiensis TaxID=633440 RepID=A0A1G8MIX9_9ACTN|nr:SDR family NAD(P)-dependent oxidoreductase [Nonomuraea jiangxiensis]SDI67852.1 NAD(P)-dependent dehydrogenase, short-chain alcohol dehydrogenase family [Nonomuraea jiangxiensis]